MKTFVYSKKTSKKIATITEVVKVEEFTKINRVVFTTASGEEFGFDTTQVKTTSYQN